MDLDLRKYHIKSEKEMIAFLELVQARIPEIIRQVKKQSMKIQSQENLIDFERKKNSGGTGQLSQGTTYELNDDSKPETETAMTDEELLLAQMREAVQPETKPVEQGEVGQLAPAAESVSAGVDSEETDKQFTKEEEKAPEKKKQPRKLGRPKKD